MAQPLATGQTTVGTSAAAIIAGNPNRVSVLIKVPSSAANGIFVSGNSAVTVSNGHLVSPGDAFKTTSQDPIYGIAAAGVSGVTYAEDSE